MRYLSKIESLNPREYLKKLNILYLDGDIKELEKSLYYLKNRVNNLYTSDNSDDALKIYKNERIDIIITDIDLLDINGLKFIKLLIKQIDPFAKVILTSNFNNIKLLSKVIDIGVSQFIQKPLKEKKILNALYRVVKELFLEEKTKEGEDLIQNLLDLQDNLIFLTNGETIYACNEKFLNFFEIKNIDEFFIKFGSIDKIYIKSKSYIYGKSWIEKTLNSKSGKNLVKIKKDTKVIVFLIKVTKFKTNYIISLTDVTSIEKEKLSHKIKADFDELTQIYNRRIFNKLLKEEVKKAKIEKTNLSIIMFDIDKFKSVNDNYGHDIGDIVLKKLSILIKKSIRKHDIFARWGGEEFIIILPDTDLNYTKELAERLRSKIENYKFEKIGKISCSFGVTKFKAESIKSLLKRVDKALFMAKENGRNRVEIL